MKKLFSIFMVFLLCIGITNVSAHTKSDTTNHSVDSGEIRWGTYRGTTKYTTARNNAISKWDAEGVINIAGDTSTTVEDLSFTDYNYDDGYFGYYQKLSGADKIAFNDVYYRNFEQCEQNKTALHEVGHALNLAHNTTSGSIMRQGEICQSSLGTHDKDDLKSRW